MKRIRSFKLSSSKQQLYLCIHNKPLGSIYVHIHHHRISLFRKGERGNEGAGEWIYSQDIFIFRSSCFIWFIQLLGPKKEKGWLILWKSICIFILYYYIIFIGVMDSLNSCMVCRLASIVGCWEKNVSFLLYVVYFELNKGIPYDFFFAFLSFYCQVFYPSVMVLENQINISVYVFILFSIYHLE